MNVAPKSTMAALLVSLSLPIWALDYDRNVDISSGLSATKQADSNDWQQQLSISPKLNLWLYPNEDLEVSIRYGLNLVSIISPSELAENNSATGADYLLGNVDSSLWLSSDSKTELSHQLEQLMVTYWQDNRSIAVGRQTISFGIAKVYSPADVIQPTSIDFSQSGYRQGVDALRATWYVNAVSELEAGIVLGDDRVLFTRLKTNSHAVDFDVTALQINEGLQLLSLGVLGGFGRIGLWQETALLNEVEELYIRSTVGADTTLFNDLYVMAEYHFNGIGEQQTDYSHIVNSEFYQLGAVQPLGKQYLSVLASKPINALVRSSVNWVANLNDQSGAGLFSVDASVSDYVSASLSLTLPYAESAGSEYESYPLIMNASVNWVF